MGAAVEYPRRDELDLGALVTLDRVAAACIDVVVRTHVARVADAKGEASAPVSAVQERVPPQGAAFQDGVNPLENALRLVRDVGVQGLRLGRLLLLDFPLARRCLRRLLGSPSRRWLARLLHSSPAGGRLGGLRGNGRCRDGRQGDQCEQFQHSTTAHEKPTFRNDFPVTARNATNSLARQARRNR